MQAIRLKTEHLFDPIGVDFTAPRLYWNCNGGKKQTAYQIVAADDSGRGLWDSGRVESAAMCVKWGALPCRRKRKFFGKYGSGMRKMQRAIGAKRPSRPASAAGRPNGSPETIRSTKKNAILWIVSARLFTPLQ